MDATLKLENCYSYLNAEPEIRQFLWEKLRFRERNYFHSSAYKQRRWDGYRNFFDRNSGKFLTGLLPEVSAVLKFKGVNYTFDDQRGSFSFATPQIDNQFLPGVTLEDYQTDFVNKVLKHKRGIIFSPTGSGKAQPLDSLVATPTGFKKMGELKLGEQVLVPAGGSAPIIGIFPQGIKKIVNVEFTNGDSVKCCEDHLWKVNTGYNQWFGKILTTKEIKTKIRCNSGACRYNIDTPKHVDFIRKEIFIDPYFLGLIIGDGCFSAKSQIGISSSDNEIIDWIKSNLLPGYYLKQSTSNKFDYKISKPKPGPLRNRYITELKNLGLAEKKSYEKFIPQNYLVTDQESRLALLQGLMDTDGYICKKAGLSYTTTSVKLMEDFRWLIHSLGGISRYREAIKKFPYKGELILLM